MALQGLIKQLGSLLGVAEVPGGRFLEDTSTGFPTVPHIQEANAPQKGRHQLNHNSFVFQV